MKLSRSHRFSLVAATALWLCLLAGTLEIARAMDHALTLYGGRITRDKWFESLPPDVNFADACILVAAMSWTVNGFHDDALTLEVEGQVVKHFGDQGHLEFNLPLAVRWNDFAWDETIDTSAAFGLGPSWATQVPPVEAEINGSTRQFMVYWFAEITAGPPGGTWALAFRLHHRSKAFGLVADEGGSNTLAAGLKFRF